MLKTIATIFLGRRARAEEALIDANAALIIEQKIREADAGHDGAKRGLAALIARSKAEKRALEAIEARIADMTGRTRAAVEAGRDSLAMDAAKLLADLENERAVRKTSLASADEKAARIRLAIEKTERQLVDLRQGLMTAKAIEAERRALKTLKGDVNATAAIREGEAVLKRLLNGADPVEEIEALEEIEASLSGAGVIDRLAAEGFGKAEKIRPEDILARFRKEPGETAPASA